MIVVDANIIAFYMIEGDQTPDAKKLWALDADWLVPPFWFIEFQSILWKFVKFAEMPGDKASKILGDAFALFSPNETGVPCRNVLREALDLKISVYDAQYVSLARECGIFFVTEDAPVRKACPDIAVSMKKYMAGFSGGNLVREQRAPYGAGRKGKFNKGPK